jgi:hypothetical protein
MPTDSTKNAKVERRLAAILAADIAGYSAIMGADEVSTVRDLKAFVLPDLFAALRVSHPLILRGFLAVNCNI